MSVKSKRMTTPTRAPLSRRDLDGALPWFRGGLGLALLAYSSLATVDGVRADCGPLCAAPIAGLPVAVPLWLVLGVAVAALLSVGEWFSSRRWWGVYVVLLFFDARYSQRWLDDWTVPLAAHNAGAGLAWGVGGVVSWGLALLVAWLGEILLFGRRKKQAEGDEDGADD